MFKEKIRCLIITPTTVLGKLFHFIFSLFTCKVYKFVSQKIRPFIYEK